MDVVHFGLIGCGDVARKRVAPALCSSPRCELVAVSRARVELAPEFAKEFGARRWYADWRELLQDDEVQAVYIATPVYLHAEQTTAAAEAQKHVLCEKPMALTVGECERMIAAAQANNVKLGISYYRHFYPVVRRLKEIISSGEIGSPVMAQCNAFEWFDPSQGHTRAWLLDKKLSGGGPMFDFGCHRIEVLLDLFGPISEVRAATSNSFFQREVEDVAVALLQFERGVSTTLTVAHSVQEPQDSLAIFGSRGSIHISSLNAGVLRIVSGVGERTESHPPAANLHFPLIEDFAAAVLENREPSVGGDIGLAVNEVLEKIYAER